METRPSGPRTFVVVFLSVFFGFLAGGAGYLAASRLLPPPAGGGSAALVSPASYQAPPAHAAPPPPAGPGGQMQDEIVAAVSRAKPGVVNIDSLGDRFPQRRPWMQGPAPDGQSGDNDQIIGSGSGFIFDAANGYVMTNQHVIEHANKVRVTLDDGRDLEAEVVGADRMSDVAVLKVDGENLPSTPIGNDKDLAVGQWVIAIGNPFREFDQTVTVGVISGLNRGLPSGMSEDRYYRNLIQTDAAINMGNSGGPLCDLNGNVIGINSAIFSPGGVNIGLGFAIPIDDAMQIARHLIDHGGVPWLGVVMFDLDAEAAKALKLTVNKGVYIQEVVPDSPAAQGGIMADDVLRSVAGTPVTNGREVELMVLGADIGQELEMTVLRAGKEKKLKVRLGTRPAR